MSLAMHDNMLAVYPHILERLRGVQGVKAVKEIGELAELVSQLREKRKTAPLDGAVYVVFGGAEPVSDAGNKQFQTERLYFTFVYCGTYLSGSRLKLYETGKVLTAVQQAFQGWLPEMGLTEGAFARTQSPPIEYHDGFAFYPVSFAVNVSIIQSSNPV